MKSALTRDECGLTLVELMIAIVVTAMVITVVSSLYAFGSKAVRIGEAQAWLQMSGEAALQTVARRVRNATSIELMSTNPASFDLGWWYVYLLDPGKESTGIIMRSPDGDERQVTDEMISGLDGLSFDTRIVGEDAILSMTIRGSYRGRAGEALTTVILGNISSLSGKGSGSSIRFKVPN
ncbi:MAG: hypothetical protein BWY92_01233 [Firmicutes bacterium ADurb.BinA052]|jgi:hypothetical protein|nr:MAG: hypothetical protein BWY92_01233 [Firmicutes bacterium ADurb.BinA052]